MAEQKINELPVTPLAEFTDNDFFVIINDNKGEIIERTKVLNWIQANVQGEKGDQGVAGANGANGTNGIDGQDGVDGLSAYQIAVNNGFVGTEQQWLGSLKGATGNSGANGTNGWSPVWAIVNRGDDRVIQITSWVGGTGTPPSTTGYIGASGIVTNIANAINIRGAQGLQGIQGVQGVEGSSGWSPLVRIETDAPTSNKYLYLYDYTGGTGTKPTTVGYLSDSGITASPVVGSEVGFATYNEAGQVKITYTGLTLNNFTANTYKKFDIISATQTIVASPTTTYPNSTPNNYAGVFDGARGTSPNGRLIENPISGQVHGWRIQGSWSGKSTVGSGVEILHLRIRNPVSGFQLVKSIVMSNNLATGDFFDELITIADSNSIPSPNGYILEVASSTTDTGLTVSIDAITRISYAKESNPN